MSHAHDRYQRLQDESGRAQAWTHHHAVQQYCKQQPTLSVTGVVRFAQHQVVDAALWMQHSTDKMTHWAVLEHSDMLL